jgi:hypothetical protein
MDRSGVADADIALGSFGCAVKIPGYSSNVPVFPVQFFLASLKTGRLGKQDTTTAKN